MYEIDMRYTTLRYGIYLNWAGRQCKYKMQQPLCVRVCVRACV